MSRVVLGLGSNLGDRRQHLREAVASLPGVVAVSDVYETDPVGGPDQDRYLNIVVVLDLPVVLAGGPPRSGDALVGGDAPGAVTPLEILRICQRLEAAAHRVRDVRWGPRTLDVDVLWIDGVELDLPELQVPHPRMFERRFVLAPLAEVAPDLLPDTWERDAVGHVDHLGPLT
ncbi:MAG TPA: 2-amino-4-hydroxy-6-hydroxymethyldihydropteridine diphosphokinase [Acidimicrobiales bacterium]|nr:2-amino-4-hydroxy-6-hydroxymethyldihydropteridine diphosphokinase [Acidimicrobiales bacterium]